MAGPKAGHAPEFDRMQGHGLLKKIFYIAVAVLVVTRLIDFVFYGGHAHDLVGAVGFGVLFAGILLDERARSASPSPARLRRRANVIAACGIALVLGSFLLEWKVFG
ncbi:hypothetical protein R1L06_10705 [Stenotrophomonas sp. C4297]|uniref:hypothetical protein n=1 Tax=Stenotrophomonas sp. C4297 TaxID=3077847 RepID=UPI00293C2FEF|nr:hypothetical protein [Stenotrophomonas sp. C4297]MDV3511198.1 hypothetical protein [Stenotrophomonas sp. C4297]